MYYGQYALGFGHDISAYYKLYKLYLYIKISHRYLLGLRADRAFAEYEQKRIYSIYNNVYNRYTFVLVVAQRFHAAHTYYNH